MTISPRFLTGYDSDRNDKGVGVRKGDFRAANDVANCFITEVGRELTREAIMDLQENLNFFELLINIDIRAVDQARHGGLRNPRDGLVENRTFDSVEEILPITEDIFHHPSLDNRVLYPILPLLDFREFLKVPFLSLFGIMNRKPKSLRKSLSSTEIIRAVCEGFEGLAAGVFLRDGGVIVEFLGDLGVRVGAFS